MPPNLLEDFGKAKNFDEIILRNQMELALNDLSSNRNLNNSQFKRNYQNNNQHHKRLPSYNNSLSSSNFLSNKPNINDSRDSEQNRNYKNNSNVKSNFCNFNRKKFEKSGQNFNHFSKK